MLTETFVSTLLEASIAGAGLVLAAYALIIPIASKVFESRASLLFKEQPYTVKALMMAPALAPSASSGKRDRFQKTLHQLESHVAGMTAMIPMYLSVGSAGVFLGYCLCALLSSYWLRGSPNIIRIADLLIGPLFSASTIIFLVVGLLTIKEIHSVLRRDSRMRIRGELEKYQRAIAEPRSEQEDSRRSKKQTKDGSKEKVT